MKILIISILSLFLIDEVKAQSDKELTDSLANKRKVFELKIDVSNGEIYLPVKKKTTSSYKKIDYLNRQQFVGTKKYQVLFRDTLLNNVVQKIPIDTVYFPQDTGKAKYKYLLTKKYLNPKVGDFIKLVFFNVPKGIDVAATVDFQDKNQESAGSFSSVLNSYQGVFEKGVQKDTALIKAQISQRQKEEIANINLDTTKLGKAQTELKATIEKLTSFPNDLKKAVSSLEDKKNKGKNDDPLHKIEVALEILGGIKMSQDSAIEGLEENKAQQIINSFKDIKDYLDEAKKLLSKIDPKSFDTLKKLVASSEKLIGNIKSTLVIKQDSLLKTIIKQDSSYNALVDSINNKRTISPLPFQVANSDLTIINFSLAKKNDRTPFTEREIILKNKYGFKLDFSTGFVGTTLRDENYRLFNRNADSSAIIKDSKGDFAIGFGLLIHAYFRTGYRWNVGLTSGFALNGSNQTINYILGLAIPLGLEQRFVISSGLLFGKIKRLSNGYKFSENTDSLYSTTNYTTQGTNWYKNIQNTGVPMTDKWSNGFFIGITYNLGTLVGTQQKKSFRIN